MSIMSSIEPGNRTTIPAKVAAALRLTASSKLVYHLDENGGVTLAAKNSTFGQLAGTFPKHKRTKAATDEEIRAAVRAGAAKRCRR